MPECDGCHEVKRDAVERIAALKELVMLRIDGVEKVQETRFVSSELALELQTGEVKRRLDDLNGEAGRLRTMQITYLPREVFENVIKELAAAIVELKAYKDTAAGRQAMLTIAISVAIAAASLLANYFALHRAVTP